MRTAGPPRNRLRRGERSDASGLGARREVDPREHAGRTTPEAGKSAASKQVTGVKGRSGVGVGEPDDADAARPSTPGGARANGNHGLRL